MGYSYLIKNVINNTVVYNLKTQTILQACMSLGIEIPRYCFHNRLSIAGNCRMCLVEVYGIQKPVASCAQRVSDGNVIVTNSEMVRRIREGISQFLLYNHPLDCAVCDQGGECDLQDQVLVYGTDKGRFFDYKRTSFDKECGPLIKTVMTRCIHCTRCVRFLDEVAGASNLSVMGRGQSMEISSYLDEVIDSEISGNLIDLCPVGALTSKPGAYNSRSWELRSLESIDIFDSLGSNIRIDTGFSEIVRIAPISNDLLNEEWISDKIRFSFDGLSISRIGSPMVRYGNGLVFVSWRELLGKLFLDLGISNNNLKLVSFVSKEVDLESMFLLKSFSNLLGSSSIVDEYNISNISYDFLDNISLNFSTTSFSNFSRFVLVGLNLKLESPLLNLKLRQQYLSSGSLNYLVGTYYKSTFPIVHLGNSFRTLDRVFFKKGGEFFENSKSTLVLFNSNSFLKSSFNVFKSKVSLDSRLQNISVISISNFSNFGGWSNLGLGNSVYSLEKTFSFCNRANKYFELGVLNMNFDSVIFKGSSRLGRYLSAATVKIEKDINFFYNISNRPLYIKQPSSSNVNIYQGHHGNEVLLSNVDYVLPSVAFIEKQGSYLNVYNLLQETSIVFTAPKLARNDLDIFKVLISFISYFQSNKLAITSKFFSGFSVNSSKLLRLVDTRGLKGKVGISDLSYCFENRLNYTNKFILSNRDSIIYSSIWENFYKTNLISNSSKVMGYCSNNLNLKFSYFLKEVF